MMKSISCLLSIIFSAAIVGSVASQPVETDFYLSCKFEDLSLMFKFNVAEQTVLNINYNDKMEIAYWSDHAINTKFSSVKSISQIVPHLGASERVAVNFNRLNGFASVAGIISPTEQEIKECASQHGFACDAWRATAFFQAVCTKVEQKF